MAYFLQPGLHVSLTGEAGTWQKLTDHNREPISISTEIIESQSRMASGKMRKYVIAKKDKISVSWKFLPTKASNVFTATYSSQGSIGSKSVLVANNTSITDNSIKSGQKITGTGFAADTLVRSVVKGATTSTIFFNKPAIAQISGTITFTEYLLADEDTKGASWITAFYNANHGLPIHLKVVQSQHTDPSIGQLPSDSTYVSSLTGEKTYDVFMTDISKTIVNRTRTTDFVDMSIEFTEI